MTKPRDTTIRCLYEETILNRGDIVALIKDILIKNEVKIPVDISESDRIPELGIDSLAFIDLVFELEERLDITITLDDTDKLQTVGGLISKIEAYLSERKK